MLSGIGDMKNILLIITSLGLVFGFQNCGQTTAEYQPYIIQQNEIPTGRFLDNAQFMKSSEIFSGNIKTSQLLTSNEFKFELNLELKLLKTIEPQGPGDGSQIEREYALTDDQIESLNQILNTSPICEYKKQTDRVCMMAMPILQLEIQLEDSTKVFWDDMCAANRFAVCSSDRREKTDEMFSWLSSVINSVVIND